VAGGFGSRRLARELALQALYSLDLNDGLTAPQALAFVAKDHGDDAESREPDAQAELYAQSLVEGTVGQLALIDEIVQKASRNWRLERMARVDRNVLRLATYELRFVPDVPMKVVINEAIEVAKRFGGAESAAFVNGLLDRISQELKRP
jgi:transcription antitermination protein NusB